jgi:hypothetical protein
MENCGLHGDHPFDDEGRATRLVGVNRTMYE